MKAGIIIQARSSSSRLPEKIFKKLPSHGDTSVLGHVINRCKKAKVDKVIVATSLLESDDKTVAEAIQYGADVFRGSLNDVLERYIQAAEQFGLDYIVRITSDCPCVEPAIIDTLLSYLKNGSYDYASNVEERTFPHGLDAEVVTFAALRKAHEDEKRPEIREHVTYHIRLMDNFTKFSYTMPHGENFSHLRLTLDTKEDYLAMRALFSMLPKDFALKDVINLYQKFPWLSELNSNIYQKMPWLNENEELIEAVKLLKLHNMEHAVKILTGV